MRRVDEGVPLLQGQHGTATGTLGDCSSALRSGWGRASNPNGSLQVLPGPVPVSPPAACAVRSLSAPSVEIPKLRTPADFLLDCRGCQCSSPTRSRYRWIAHARHKRSEARQPNSNVPSTSTGWLAMACRENQRGGSVALDISAEAHDGSSGRTTGRSTVTNVPCPLESTRTSPPWAKTTRRAIGRPNPNPRAFVVPNGENNRGRISSGIPRPSSRTESRIRSPSACAIRWASTWICSFTAGFAFSNALTTRCANASVKACRFPENSAHRALRGSRSARRSLEHVVGPAPLHRSATS